MMGVSKPIFGQFLGVDVKTVRSWEQGRRVPSGMARRFLEETGVTEALEEPPEGRSSLSIGLNRASREPASGVSGIGLPRAEPGDGDHCVGTE